MGPSMGGKISDEDLAELLALAESARSLFKQRTRLEKYLDKKIKGLAPNAQAIIGTMITAKLIEHAGSLKTLVKMPASTIQLLGAEKALFRHLKNKKSKCPKFGYIFNHQSISGQKRSRQGMAARLVASKLSLAVKVDYFKGKFIGDKLKKEIEAKLRK